MGERIDIGGRSLFTVQRGAGEPLLLIQGMSGTHASWGEPFLSALDPAHATISYDHRGIGRSDPAGEPFSLVDLADDALALLDTLGHETVHVMGISMGGMVAQELTLKAPERVRSLTLGCTYSGGEGSALAAPETIQRLSEGMMSGDRERAIRTGYEINVSAPFAADEANWPAFLEMATSTPAPIATIMLQMQAIGVHDTLARLGGVTTPTLVVHGTADLMLPAANGELIAAAIPGARLELLDGVGHMFWWERPEQSAALVTAHCAGATDRA